MSDLELKRPLAGFSLIELVAVIGIVGILAIVALPRFVDFSQSARDANLIATSRTFKVAADLAHARWIARGSTASLDSVTVEGGGIVGVNDAGWPENGIAAGGDGAVTASECLELWSRLLSAAPGISTTAGAADWQASAQGTTTCRFSDQAATGRYFDYQSSTGVITPSVASTTGSSGSSTPASASDSASGGASPSSSSGSGASGTTPTCGLVGLEPFLVLLFVRRRPR